MTDDQQDRFVVLLNAPDQHVDMHHLEERLSFLRKSSEQYDVPNRRRSCW